LERWVQSELQPDVTLLFDVPVEVSMQRLSATRVPDKFEREDADFFSRIRQAYLQRAQENPARFRVIDASVALTEVVANVEAILATI
jgi:dTMP kinase